MSKVQLGTINFSMPTQEINYYLGAIVNSESGFLTPKLIQNANHFRLIYGDFPYVDMYERLIKTDGLPSAILPLLTPKSDYNRASLRLFNDNPLGITHAHPRYNKEYQYKSSNSVIVRTLGPNDTDVLIKTNSKFPAPFLFITDHDGVRMIKSIPEAHYIFDGSNWSLHIKTNEGTIGELIIFTYPKYDAEVGHTMTFQLNPITGGVADSVTINLSSPYVAIPEFLLIEDGTNNTELELLDYNAQFKVGNPNQLIVENLSDKPAKLYVRYYSLADRVQDIHAIPATQPKEWVYDRSDDLPYKPDVLAGIETANHICELDSCEVIFEDESKITIAINEPGNNTQFRINYFKKIEDNEAPVTTAATEEQIESGEYVYTNILDFTYVVDINDNLSEGWMVLRVGDVDNNGVVTARKICYHNGILPPTEYYTELYTKPNQLGSDLTTFTELLTALRSTLGSDNVATVHDECYNALFESWDFPEDLIIDLTDTETIVFDDMTGPEIYERLLSNLWSQELFTIPIETLIREIKAYVNENPSFTFDNLVQYVLVLEDFNEARVLVTYPNLSMNINLYDWNPLKIDHVFNADQDQLCSRLEKNKVIDFYSKIKGPQGENLKISVSESPYPDCWIIDIELGILSESFYCYSVKNDYLPESAIDIRLLGKYSELVDVKVYDYLLPNGTKIDQLDYLDLFGDYSEYNPERVISLNIPEVKDLHLMRLDPEVLNSDSYRLSLRTFHEAEIYPDLFLVTKLMYNDQLKDLYSFVRGSEQNTLGGMFEEGRYSQVLVRLGKVDIMTPLINANNRILYFYDNFKIDGVSYPTFYPYISNIIDGKLLQLDDSEILDTCEKFIEGNMVLYNGDVHQINSILPYRWITLSGITDPIKSTQVVGNIELGAEVEYTDENDVTENYIIESIDEVPDCILTSIEDPVSLSELKPITEFLDANNINYLHYDNLSYFYPNLFETGQMHKLFIAQFDCSKVSRGFYEWGRNLITSNQRTYNNRVENLLSRLRSCMPYVSTLIAESSLDNAANKLSVHTTLNMQRLINKTFTIDFELNLT